MVNIEKVKDLLSRAYNKSYDFDIYNDTAEDAESDIEDMRELINLALMELKNS